MRKILFTLLLAYTLTSQASESQINMTQEQIDNLGIKVAPLVTSQKIPLLYAPARVVVPADREILLSSPQPGLLTKLQVNLGDKVEKNQILAQVTSPELVILQKEFLTASSEANLSGLEQHRDQSLLQEGVIAERRWQETESMHRSKTAQVDEARQLLLIAGMEPAEIQTLAKTHKLSNQINIRSPLNGVVLERLATLGSRLDIQAPLYRIADLSELWLEINIPQERLHNLHIGDEVHVVDSNVTAKLSLLGQNVDAKNQTVLARAIVAHKMTTLLRVGQTLNIQIVQNTPEQGFRIPNAAIAQNGGDSYVFVRKPSGFTVTKVTVMGKYEDETLVSGALLGDEQIATQGAVALKANWLGLGGGE